MKMAGIAAGCLVFFAALSGCGSKRCEITYERRPSAAPTARYADGAARRKGDPGGVAAIPVPMVEVDEKLVEVVEKERIVPPGTPAMIDFPVEADSPNQFGLEAEARSEEEAVAAIKAANEAAKEAAREVAEQPEIQVRNEKAPSAPVGAGDAGEMAVLPVVPEVFPATHYTFPPEEAARVLDDVFRDPFAPDKYALVKVEAEAAGEAEEQFDLATGPLLTESGAAAPEVAALEEVVTESVAVAVTESIAIPESISESLRPPPEIATLPVPTPPLAVAPALPPPSEEFVQMSIGLTLDEKEFPLTRPAALAAGSAQDEYGLDKDREFVPMPVKGESVEEEDELEFFGRMSNTLDLEMVE